MGIKLTHTCDRCGAEVTPNSGAGEFWEVGVLARPITNYGAIHLPHSTIHTLERDYKMFLCKVCMHGMGMKFKDKDRPAPDSPPSLDDIIQDIVDNAVTAALNEDR